jgi:hypothetical protein
MRERHADRIFLDKEKKGSDEANSLYPTIENFGPQTLL